MKIGSYKVLVKPALGVLVAAVIVAAIAIPVMKRYNTAGEPAFGLVTPARWKFETHGGAQATLTMADAAGAMNLRPVRGGLYQVDSDDGFTIVIQHAGKSADSVYLRNAFSLDQPHPSGDLHFQFEAMAPQPLTVLFTVRDGSLKLGRLLWSHQFPINNTAWATYDATIPEASVQQATASNLIVTAQLGDATGTVGMRHIYIR